MSKDIDENVSPFAQRGEGGEQWFAVRQHFFGSKRTPMHSNGSTGEITAHDAAGDHAVLAHADDIVTALLHEGAHLGGGLSVIKRDQRLCDVAQRDGARKEPPQIAE